MLGTTERQRGSWLSGVNKLVGFPEASLGLSIKALSLVTSRKAEGFEGARGYRQGLLGLLVKPIVISDGITDVMVGSK
jgi:hypothetical protein